MYDLSMSASNYNSDIRYEALQEVITQLIAKLYFELNNKEINDRPAINETITNLINFKQNMIPDDEKMYDEAYAYVKEAMTKWNF